MKNKINKLIELIGFKHLTIGVLSFLCLTYSFGIFIGFWFAMLYFSTIYYKNRKRAFLSGNFLKKRKV